MQLATLARPVVTGLLAVAWLAPSEATGQPKVKLTPTEIDLGIIQEGNLFERFIEVEVEGERSGIKRTRTYRAKRSASGLRPSRRYLRVLCEGARENGLPPSYIREIDAHPSVHVPVLSGIVERGISLFETLVQFFDRLRAC